MADKSPRTAKAKPDRDRDERLKAALKANLARRKAQAKARGGQAKQQTGKSEGQ